MYSAKGKLVVGIAVALIAALSSAAQSTDTRELQTYVHAVTQASAAARTNGLRDFLSQWPQSSLRKDALEWLAWQTRDDDRSMAAGYAGEVLKIEPTNTLALAMKLDAAAPKSAQEQAELAQRGIDGLKSMRAPAGMGAGEFYLVQKEVTAILCAAYGNAAFAHKDYDTAREYLRRAVSISPDDARYAYSLGLADLNGKNQNASEGYFQLARAVNLARGTAAAQQINEFAAERYRKDGGKPSDWNGFLVAAASPTAAAPNATTVASAAPAPPATKPPEAYAAPDVHAPSTSVTSTSLPNASELPRGKVTDVEVAGLPGPDAAHRQPFRAGAPLSLGILIEASLANKENRKTIENALGDLVRHLTANQNSEAFVLSFGKDVVFNEDLTGDYKSLEKAMDRIRPEEGTALLDAVALAAFQLNRVSREGNNRVLLVISDGRNLDSKSSAGSAVSQLDSGNVRVYCIGVGALGTDGGQRLQVLASRTGGDTAFIPDASHFRGAAQELAAKFGVEFPY